MRASLRVLNTPPYDNLGLPYHRSFAQDSHPLIPGQPVELVFDMAPISWIFKAGHSLRLQIKNIEVARHGGTVSTPVLSPSPAVTVYYDVGHSSFLAMPVTAPIRDNVQASRRGKLTIAQVSFPPTLDRRYLADIQKESVTCNGSAAARVEPQGSTLQVTCAEGTPAGAKELQLTGAFGSKYAYGDQMRFEGTVRR